jgi:hypothetical protein
VELDAVMDADVKDVTILMETKQVTLYSID